MSARTLALAMLLVLATLAAIGCDVPPPRFSHREHLTAKTCGAPGLPPCPTCISCHAGIRQSEERAFPRETDCARCHAPGTSSAPPLPAAASTAPAERPSPEHVAATAIIFSHERHLPRPGIRNQCMKCHTGIVKENALESVFPPMAACVGCHADEFGRGECAMCHKPGDLRKLVPQTYLRHDASFMRKHGMAAAGAAQVCSQCHTKSECATCHDTTQSMTAEARIPEAIGRELIHRADFLTRHSIEARSAPATCARCHTPQTCDACHVERGVSANGKGGVNPHPIGWIGPETASRDFHGRAAKLDIFTCAACHDRGPATNCIRCHKVGGYGGNPHPSGWRSARSPQAAMCRYCHGG